MSDEVGAAAEPDRGTGPVPVDDYLPIAITEVEIPALHALVAAERAVSANTATPAQIHGVRAAGRNRRSDDRIAAWRASQPAPPAAPR